MRRTAIAVVLVVAGLAGCAPHRLAPPAREPALATAIRVLVFNIHAGKDMARASNLERVADLVRSTGAELVLLQEVDRGTKRSGKVDQLGTIRQRLDHAAAFGRTLDYDGGEYGIGVLARYGFATYFTSPLKVEPVQMRAGRSYEPRAALLVVPLSLGLAVIAINTHLDASRDDGYRLQEVEGLLALARTHQRADSAILLGGDFNAEPGSDVHNRVLAAGFRDAWLECGSGNGLTFPADVPVKRIDYLFLANPLRCTDARVVETTMSDHRPLLVTVTR